VIAAQDRQVPALDQAGFIALVEPELLAAYRLAVAMLRSEIKAEDAVQEAVLKAWRHRGRFRAGSAMRPWLLAIVANECRAARRSRWWSVIRRPDAPEADPIAAEPSDAALRGAILKLPHEQRLAIVLRYYLDLPFAEVAAVLRISPKAAKSRTYRALERLRLSPEVLGDE
jgi:RNA polymerase sigma-70 factor (ECF subfamily)